MLLKRESVSNKLLLRRGIVGNDCDGTPLLINGRGEAYRVNDTAVSLWNMCNGITFDDLVLEVLRISSSGEGDVRKSLEHMIRKFQKIGVIELRDQRYPRSEMQT
jgi:coenzyme PQQ synthesis protein D (PqqD)